MDSQINTKTILQNCVAFIFPLFLLGCYESTDVTIHEPGVYNGKIDKHDKTPSERSEILRQRVIAVQTDR